jgi:hypothetical protein
LKLDQVFEFVVGTILWKECRLSRGIDKYSFGVVGSIVVVCSSSACLMQWDILGKLVGEKSQQVIVFKRSWPFVFDGRLVTMG